MVSQLSLAVQESAEKIDMEKQKLREQQLPPKGAVKVDVSAPAEADKEGDKKQDQPEQ
jgi:hypothetical protein